MRTLMLTPWMAPHEVIPWQRAVVLTILGKVEVVAEYDEVIRSPSVEIRTPAVVRLTRSVLPRKRLIRFSRTNVYTRDGFRCQYCGEQKLASQLNYDHVLPRVRGGKTEWTNIVTCCYACNDKKGARTPDEAKMRLLRKPQKPTWLPALASLDVDVRQVPEPWVAFCV
jgi:5-methylcytosine-specific restriction endonuclease McrA